jgi:hypothetical protein
VVTRSELDVALQAVVMGMSKNAGLPVPGQGQPAIAPVFRGSPATAAAEPQDQLAAVMAGLSQQMAQINQQLGI